MQAHPFSRFDATDVTARLIFTPCPGTQGAPLEDALATLQEAGADALLTVMPDAELALNEVSRLGAACADRGLAWFHLPVADDAAPGPDFEEAWANAREEIGRRLARGERLAIHCKGGSGRTGLVATVLLLEAGLRLEQAILQVQALRPKALQHPVHLDWIRGYASR